MNIYYKYIYSILEYIMRYYFNRLTIIRIDQLQSMLLELRNDLKDFQTTTTTTLSPIATALSSSSLVVNERIIIAKDYSVSELIPIVNESVSIVDDDNIPITNNTNTTCTLSHQSISSSIINIPPMVILTPQPNIIRKIILRIKYIWSAIRSRMVVVANDNMNNNNSNHNNK